MTKKTTNIDAALDAMQSAKLSLSEISDGFASTCITGEVDRCITYLKRKIAKVKEIAEDLPNIKKDLSQMSFEFEAQDDNEGDKENG